MARLSRRSFIKNTLATAATITIAGTKSSGRVLGANDVIRVGCAGIHGRGSAHVGAYTGIKGVQVTYLIDPDTGKMTLRDGDDVGPDYVLEPVKEERLALLTLTRISRVKEIRDGPKVLTKPEPDHTVPRDPEQIEKMRQAYFQNFLRQLP